jgi:VanZ family protein
MLRPLGVDRRADRGRNLQPGSGPSRGIALTWLWVVAWIAVVQTFASGSFSAHETSRLVGPLLRWLIPNADAETAVIVNFAIRKTAHFVEYAILALLALRAFRSSSSRSLTWLAAASLALTLAVAVVDESRQAAAAERTGALSDVALDITAAAAALLLALKSAGRRYGRVRT